MNMVSLSSCQVTIVISSYFQTSNGWPIVGLMQVHSLQCYISLNPTLGQCDAKHQHIPYVCLADAQGKCSPNAAWTVYMRDQANL